ncbi:MAG: hypothetical protein WBQ17_11330 [Rhizomicrobium sp.]
MQRLFWAAIIVVAATCPSIAAAPDYVETPMTAADVDMYLSVLRAAADHTSHLSDADKNAAAYIRKYHGNPPIPQMPNMATMPTTAQMAAYGKKMGDALAIQNRAQAVANYDETIAKQRGVQDRYDGIKSQASDLIQTNGTGIMADGPRSGDSKESAANLAEDNKRAAVSKADWALVRPHSAEIQSLQKKLRAAGGQD